MFGDKLEIFGINHEHYDCSVHDCCFKAVIKKDVVLRLRRKDKRIVGKTDYITVFEAWSVIEGKDMCKVGFVKREYLKKGMTLYDGMLCQIIDFQLLSEKNLYLANAILISTGYGYCPPLEKNHHPDRNTCLDTKTSPCIKNIIITDNSRLRLRNHIIKIKKNFADAIKGHGETYLKRNNKELPQEMVDKIVLFYHSRIELSCHELGLSVEEEEQWDMEAAGINEDELSKSGEEYQEDKLDDVFIYACKEEEELKKYNSEDEDEDEDNDYNDYDVTNVDEIRDTTYMDMVNQQYQANCLRQVKLWEHEIEILQRNMDDHLVIINRMTNSTKSELVTMKKNDVRKRISFLQNHIRAAKQGNMTFY